MHAVSQVLSTHNMMWGLHTIGNDALREEVMQYMHGHRHQGVRGVVGKAIADKVQIRCGTRSFCFSRNTKNTILSMYSRWRKHKQKEEATNVPRRTTASTCMNSKIPEFQLTNVRATRHAIKNAIELEHKKAYYHCK